MKRKTVGVDPKVPAQLIAAALVWVAARFGLDLDPEVAAAVAAAVGAAAGVLAPAPRTVAAEPVRRARKRRRRKPANPQGE